MATTTGTKGWTVTQVQQLFPEPLDDTRYELIDGELYVSTQPSWQHQLAGTNVLVRLREWANPIRAGMALHAPGLVFAEDEAVAPDVVWISRERLAEVLDPGGRLRAAPDLVAEVLSPGAKNIQRDREAKLDVYTRRGVREYWILDWLSRSVDVYRRDAEGHLTLVATLGLSDVLRSPILPGFACQVSRFFDGIP